RSINPTSGRVTFSLRDQLPFEGLSFRSAYEAEGAAMSQSSSGAPGWQLEGNAPLAYDTHIVDVFLQDYSRRLVEVRRDQTERSRAGRRVRHWCCDPTRRK